MIGYILAILALIFLFIIVFTNWSDYALRCKSLYPLYRVILEGRASHLYNQFKYVCDREHITYNSVIDFGSGFGGLSEMLRRNNKTIASIDTSNHYIYENTNNLLILENTKNLPFDDHKFHIAVSSYVFHHIPKDQHAIYITELLRVSPILILIEEHPRRNLLCRFINSEVLTHANAHMTMKQWNEHIVKMNLQISHHKLNRNEFALVIRDNGVKQLT